MVDFKLDFLDHVAIRVKDIDVSVLWYEKVLGLKRYQDLGLSYSFQDHHYFHSIYTKDLDGHVVELTTLVVNEKEFYT